MATITTNRAYPANASNATLVIPALLWFTVEV